MWGAAHRCLLPTCQRSTLHPPPALADPLHVQDPDGYWIEILNADNARQFVGWGK